jgi:hypothetical protein
MKRRLFNCNTNIFFKQRCLQNGLTPNYANTKIPVTKEASRYTKIKAQKRRLKDELKFSFIKRQNLDQEIFKVYLKLVKQRDLIQTLRYN